MSNNLVTLSRGQQAVTGLPIGKLNDLERRLHDIETNGTTGGNFVSSTTTRNLTVSTSAPSNPQIFDLWYDIS